MPELYIEETDVPEVMAKNKKKRGRDKEAPAEHVVIKEVTSVKKTKN